MPTVLNYPGVYIEEVPSGSHAITGVSTSVTAFIGAASQGPCNTPVVINSYADFERIFGGLWLASKLGYAVRDFYLNGGNQAIIVRVFHYLAVEGEVYKTQFKIKCGALSRSSKASFALNENEDFLILEAANEGIWGNRLEVVIDHDVMAKERNEVVGTTFNLTVKNAATNTEEQYFNLTISEGPRAVTNILANSSNLLRVKKPLPTSGIPMKEVTKIEVKQDGANITTADVIGVSKDKTGMHALDGADIFNLLCIPPYENNNQDVNKSAWKDALDYCVARRAFLLVDSPSDWNNKDVAKSGLEGLGLTNQKNAAIYFPRIKASDPLRDNVLNEFVPSGAIAGIYARIDAQRGVWKAPAGIEANILGALQLTVPLTDAENGELNPLGLNCLRTFPAAGQVVWGARTLSGADRLASEWKYIPVRRLALYVEESFYRGMKWAVFEPNNEVLWRQITVNGNSFMNDLFRQGAFQGMTPATAYFVKCDKDTTTQSDIDHGIVNVWVGFAPLKPSEFVVIKLQQMAGQTQ